MLIVLGTRPEVIKLAPVVRTLRAAKLDVRVMATGQHRHLLDQALDLFGLVPDIDLNLMRAGQPLASLTARIIQHVDEALAALSPDFVIVQGDTTTAFGAALAAFYRGIPVGHVEAGLRTGDLSNPFPEEANRQLTRVLGTLHFAPTEAARLALLRESVPDDRIMVTGNTVVDALSWLVMQQNGRGFEPRSWPSTGSRLVLVTAHRRESWGRPIVNICEAVRSLASRHEDVDVVFPLHANAAGEIASDTLKDTPRVHLTQPLDYATFVRTLQQSALVLTDSGGVLEEAVSLGRPVLVLRTRTERFEACDAGAAELVGTDADGIVAAASRVLSGRTIADVIRPGLFGDGQAAHRIAVAVERWFSGTRPLLDAAEGFVPAQLALNA